MRKLTIILAMLCTLGLGAQSLEVGLYGGVSTYHGDLTPGQFSIKSESLHPAAGVFARLGIADRFSFRMSLLRLSVSGDDARYDVPRNLAFESDITEVALTVELHPFRVRLGQAVFQPYAFAGLASFRFNPTTTYEGRTVELQPLGTEGQGLPGYDEPYELSQFAIPIGGGIKWLLDDRWTLGLEYGGRKLFTDYLDDIGSSRVNYGDLVANKDPAVARLSNPNLDPNSDALDQTYKRGGEQLDWYSSLGLTLSYRFGGEDDGRRSGKAARCYSF